MTRTGDQALIKELNQSIVLNFLRFHSPISRAQISKRTGLNKATVSSIVDGLIEDGLVLEVGHGHTGVGRRPVLLDFNAALGYAIGVDLGVDYLRMVVTDLSAKIISVSNVECNLLDAPPATSLSTISKLIQDVISSVPDSKLGVIGVGIGVPALVDYSRGIVLNAPNLKWYNVHLKAVLENHLRLPVLVDNEANAGALGEKLFGSGRQVSDLVYISTGVGIGTGVIVRNELVRGAHGVAGEFGHMTIEVNGLKCTCGNNGCLEMYASEKALVNKYYHLTGKTVTGRDIIQLLSDRDPSALEAIQATARYLGVGISNLLNGLNPDLIIIGNRLSEAQESILRPIEDVVKARCFTMSYTNTRIEVSSLGRDACAVGAASLILHKYFESPLLNVNVEAKGKEIFIPSL